MKKVLINFAHPVKSRSKINIAMRNCVEGIENITVNDLYTNYPDFLIDVKREQELCEEHDIIIFQHPFYWYSTPAIMKEWFDMVLEHDWAYGSYGNALNGKIFFQAITAGGDDSTYKKEGFNYFTIGELTTPIRATANLCKMKWLPPFTVLGVHRGLNEKELKIHTEEYLKILTFLRDDKIDLKIAIKQKYLNSDFDSIIRRV